MKIFMMFMDQVKQKNVLGENLELCSNKPVTGWFRDGCCNTDENDHGLHTVCAKVTTKFLEWCKESGNDLITPHPEFGFPGLKDGDSWCVCATWYARAVDDGKGCPIFLIRTHENTLNILPIETHKKFAIDLSYLHISIFWSTSTLWRDPSYILRWLFNIAGFTMNTILRINHKFI